MLYIMAQSFFNILGKLVKFKWENAMTIDKDSWGYRYNANVSRYYTTEELVKILIDTVRYNWRIIELKNCSSQTITI